MINLCLIVPCYNEEEVVEKSVKVLVEKLKKLIANQIVGGVVRFYW